jgi:hypothetical protein
MSKERADHCVSFAKLMELILVRSFRRRLQPPEIRTGRPCHEGRQGVPLFRLSKSNLTCLLKCQFKKITTSCVWTSSIKMGLGSVPYQHFPREPFFLSSSKGGLRNLLAHPLPLWLVSVKNKLTLNDLINLN